MDPHRDQSYPGEHDAIVPQKLWQRVQEKLKSDHQDRRNGLRMNSPGLLVGLLENAQGQRFTPSHTVKNGKRYRYYVCEQGKDNPGGTARVRVPAHEIEALVSARFRSFAGSGEEALRQLACPGQGISAQQQIARAAAALNQNWPSTHSSELRELLRRVINKILLHEDNVEIFLSKSALIDDLIGKDQGKSFLQKPARTVDNELSDLICLKVEAKFRRVKGELTLVIPSPSESDSGATVGPVHSLVKAVARGRAWYEQVLAGKVSNQRSLAREMGISERYAGRICECAFLAPDIVEAILEGRQPRDLTFEKLTKGLPMVWSEQRRLLGFGLLSIAKA